MALLSTWLMPPWILLHFVNSCCKRPWSHRRRSESTLVGFSALARRAYTANGGPYYTRRLSAVLVSSLTRVPPSPRGRYNKIKVCFLALSFAIQPHTQ
ncbi:hypothetical protein BGY98DRAFT_412949 [Russula aff. rugulosa BPL654]|nr:hypothetical protein BGY98DRAFT_412949 [Russula aff. rugulosa BPL654]